MPLPLRAHSATHPGLVHPKNEDAWAVLPTTEGGLLLMVCDGMGGMGRGDEASKLAIEVLSEVMSEGDGLPPDRMRQALRVADQRIRDVLCGDYEQPGSTAVMVYVLDGAAHVAWVGDSRAYLIRNGRVLYRTRDHKLVEELVDAGQLTPDEARESTLAHVVTRALGGRSPAEPAVHPATLGYPWKLQRDDRVLLCSDGVCDLVEDDEIGAMVDRSSPAEGTARLVETSLLRGGHDNITCIVAVWDGASWVDDDAATPIISGGRQGLPPHVDSGWEPDGGNRVTEEIDLGRMMAEENQEEDEADLAFADLPTAEVDRRPPPPPRPVPQVDVSPGSWLGAGLVALVLAIVAWIIASI